MTMVDNGSGSERPLLNGKVGGTALWLEMVRAAQSLGETGAFEPLFLQTPEVGRDGHRQLAVHGLLGAISFQGSCFVAPMSDLEAAATVTALRQLQKPVSAESSRSRLHDSCGNGNSQTAGNGNVAANGNTVGNGNRRA